MPRPRCKLSPTSNLRPDDGHVTSRHPGAHTRLKAQELEHPDSAGEGRLLPGDHPHASSKEPGCGRGLQILPDYLTPSLHAGIEKPPNGGRVQLSAEHALSMHGVLGATPSPSIKKKITKRGKKERKTTEYPAIAPEQQNPNRSLSC